MATLIGHHKLTFTPTGPPNYRGRGAKAYLENRTVWSGAPVPAARLFVGLNVGDDPVWSIRDVIDLVAAVRLEQTGDPSASFVAQKGTFKHKGGHVVEEDSVQVIIFNPDDDTDDREFEKQMVDLGSSLAETLQQELVIVEMQSDGKVSKTIGVGP